MRSVGCCCDAFIYFLCVHFFRRLNSLVCTTWWRWWWRRREKLSRAAVGWEKTNRRPNWYIIGKGTWGAVWWFNNERLRGEMKWKASRLNAIKIVMVALLFFYNVGFYDSNRSRRDRARWEETPFYRISQLREHWAVGMRKITAESLFIRFNWKSTDSYTLHEFSLCVVCVFFDAVKRHERANRRIKRHK